MANSPIKNLSTRTKLIAAVGLAMALVASGSVWTLNIGNAATEECAKGNPSRYKLVDLLESTLRTSDNSGILNLTSGWSLDPSNDSAPSYAEQEAIEVQKLQRISSTLSSNPISTLLYSDLANKANSLKSEFEKLKIEIKKKLDDNVFLTRYIDAETSVLEISTKKMNDDLDNILYGFPKNPLLGLQLKYATSSRDDLSKKLFTPEIVTSLTKSITQVKDATTALSLACMPKKK